MREIFTPKSLDELLSDLDRRPDGLLLAGGTDLLVKLSEAPLCDRPPPFICLEGIGEMKSISEADGVIRIGAALTHRELQKNDTVVKKLGVLVQALNVLGSPQIRAMGTIGGNICTASPAGDTLPPLHVLDARIEIASRQGVSTVAVGDFITGPGRTVLKEKEVVTAIIVPVPAGCPVHHYEKVGQRNALAISIVSLAAVVYLSREGIIEKIRLAWGSVAPSIVVSRELEKMMEGRPLTAGALRDAVHLVGEAVTPIDDLRASAWYRRTVAGNLLYRLLRYAESEESSFPGMTICGSR